MPDVPWRKSSYSSGSEHCVELASAGGAVHLRNSNHPDAGALVVAGDVLSAWVQGIKAGDYDDLAG